MSEFEERLRARMNQITNEDRLEGTLADTTKATVGVGAGAMALDIGHALFESEALGHLAGLGARVFGGLVWVDVGLSMYLLYRRSKRNVREREEQVVVEVPV